MIPTSEVRWLPLSGGFVVTLTFVGRVLSQNESFRRVGNWSKETNKRELN